VRPLQPLNARTVVDSHYKSSSGGLSLKQLIATIFGTIGLIGFAIYMYWICRIMPKEVSLSVVF
jgi:hypothetical protein